MGPSKALAAYDTWSRAGAGGPKVAAYFSTVVAGGRAQAVPAIAPYRKKD
jgi:hypothetical protein